MLASASPVFYSMFNGSMAEQGDVVLPDLEVDAFKDMLKFIYTDEVDVNATITEELMYGSDKYIIEVLKEKCISFLTTSVDDENACVVLQTAYRFHLDTLKQKALNFILKIGNSCLSSKTFLRLSKECVQLILESDNLHCSEEIVFEKIVEWSKQKCQEQAQDIEDENIRTVLGDLLYLIRFPVMGQKYFTPNISKRCILTLEEIVKVYQTYYEDNSKPFSKKRRSFDMESVQILRCEANAYQAWNQHGNSDSLDITTNYDAFIVGIYVFGSTTYSGQHDIKVDLLQSDFTLGSISTKLYSVAGHQMYCINFTSPIRITKDIRYCICLTMKGPLVFKGENYKSVVTSEDRRIVTFLNSSSSQNGTGAKDGQIPGILLSSM